jgi:hypothetical protein
MNGIMKRTLRGNLKGEREEETPILISLSIICPICNTSVFKTEEEAKRHIEGILQSTKGWGPS